MVALSQSFARTGTLCAKGLDESAIFSGSQGTRPWHTACSIQPEMSRRVGPAIAFSAALLAGVFTNARQGRACSPPPDGWFFFALAGAAPANGVMIVHLGCYTSCEVEPDLDTFVLARQDPITMESTPVPGSLVMTGTRDAYRFLVFLPESGELTVGDTYVAELEGVMPLTGLTVAPETTWKTAFDVTHEASEVDHPRGDRVCCSGPLDSCGGTPCFRTEVDRRTAVHVTWDDGTTEESTQYAYRLLFEGDDTDVPWSWNGASASFELARDASSVCYTLELKRLTDGFVHRLNEHCLERPDDHEPGIHPTPEEDIQAMLESCDAAPDGYEASWCAARKELCEGSSEPWCENWEPTCIDGGTAGTGGSAGSSGGSSGSAGSSSGHGGNAGSSSGRGGSEARGGTAGTAGGTGGSGEAGGAGDGSAGEDGDGERVYTKGCGCALPGGGKPAPSALAFAALGLAALARRRRNRA